MIGALAGGAIRTEKQRDFETARTLRRPKEKRPLGRRSVLRARQFDRRAISPLVSPLQFINFFASFRPKIAVQNLCEGILRGKRIKEKENND
jgi:hypothetical protein